MTMNAIHEKHWSEFMSDEHHRSLYGSWWTQGTVNYWRHTRLLEPVLEVLKGLTQLSWVTIGDGAGTDAWRLLTAGFKNVLATDLDVTVLHKTMEAGYIQNFQVQNAEKMTLPDNSVDFVLCKEALHHMSRPYAAIYEFFRVARYGVVVIEPQDPWLDWPCRTDDTTPHYESVGNYVYQFSAREFEKIALAMNIMGVATKKMVDVYVPGCEFAYCVEGDPVWKETCQRVDDATAAMRAGTVKENYVQGVFFKNSVAPELFDFLANNNPSWRFMRTDINPYLDGKSAT